MQPLYPALRFNLEVSRGSRLNRRAVSDTLMAGTPQKPVS